MENLARQEAGIKGMVTGVQTGFVRSRVTAFRKGNVVYGYFGMEAGNQQARHMENTKSMLRESVKAGILFGLKVFASGVVGLLLVQLILECMNVSVRIIPIFAIVLLWLSCSGSCFCLAGLFRNINSFLFRQEEKR